MPRDAIIIEVTDAHLAIMKAKNLKMLETDGTLCHLYQRKTSGERCSHWDERRQQCGEPNCEECYGAGWVGGYVKVENIYFRFPMAVREIIWTEHGLNLEQIPKVWTITDETITIRDFIERIWSSERFNLNSVEKGEWRNVLLHTQAEVEIIEKGDIRQQVP